MSTVSINFEKTVGPIKPMHAVNNGPIKAPASQTRGNFDLWLETGIPYARNHDASFCSSYGGEHCVDVWCIFPNPDADVNDPASYDFTLTDEYIATTMEAGTQVFYRLGSKIEHWKKKYGILPPPDFQKWAEICEHIILHYNEGWADGFHHNIEYWEIWNEPDNEKDEYPIEKRQTWGGTKAQFFDFYEIAAKHLKSRFPHLKIGGPALSWLEDWAYDFLGEMSRRGVPLDFFSWHRYCMDPKQVIAREKVFRGYLDEFGYTQTESICNEWNYVKDWSDNFIKSIETIISMKGAALTAGCMLGSQQTTMDMLMYYDAQPTIWNGLFDYYTFKPLKGYYPFVMFNTLYKLGTSVEVAIDDECVYAAAAKDADNRQAIMICYYTDEEETMPVKDIVLDMCASAGSYELYLLDDAHTNECIHTGPVTSVTLKPNSVVLLKSC